jgi:GNAT superfamily N-acetyltransferase
MTTEITIEGLTSELLAAYHSWNLERTLYGPGAVEWTFGANKSNFAVARHEGRIVGISGNIRHSMKLGNTIGLGYQAVDSFVAPEMRGQGLFVKLAHAFANKSTQVGADLVWGFPNDNAKKAWFQRLDWSHYGQVPFLIKPLRAGYLLRRLRLSGDFSIARGRDQNLTPVTSIGPWADAGWDKFSQTIGCATIRDAAFLNHRLFDGPHKNHYRIVSDQDTGTLVASREMQKHGARVAYIMEAMGGADLQGMLVSELAKLRDRGVEISLAWALPGSPNYIALRKAGFMPFPERLRPISIWFGGRPITPTAQPALDRKNWYLSYLDSDTV